MSRLAFTFQSPLGPVILTSDGIALTGLYFEGQRHFPEDASAWRWDETTPLFDDTRRQILAYLAGERTGFDVPIAPSGTDFQRRVWRELGAIPYGSTQSYGDLAQRLGEPSAARAVGAAVGRNPISLVIPCHRVVGQQGQLTGYAGGLDRKRALLELEARGSGHPPLFR